VALSAKNQVDEFRHLASGAHYYRVRLTAFDFVLFPRFIPAFIEVTATRHFKAAPFALDSMQTADILSDPSLLRFHDLKATTLDGQRLSTVTKRTQCL
jgi:hypothetical protein